MRTLPCALLVLVAAGARSSGAERPNIVFMLSDDQGWNGLSVAMHEGVEGSRSDFYRTPCLEKFARQGMRFSAAYAPAPVCSPTRCSLQTGKSPARNRWTKAAPTVTAADGHRLIAPRIHKNLSTSETTVAELLREAGYATAHFGKWHLGGGGPGRHGYDEHDGDIGNEYARRFPDPNPVDIFGMARRAGAFMEKHSRGGKPFFLQLSWHALHSPENSLVSTQREYAGRPRGRVHSDVLRAAITENLDTGVGRVLEAIDRLGIADRTFVIYMSDNGSGSRRSGPLRGGKGSVWEGGIRVPLIIRGPGVTANSWCHTRVVGFDFFPTFCEWAGVRNLPAGIEGGSLIPLLENDGRGEVRRPREELVFHFPHYQSSDGPHSAILLGDLKLIKFFESDRLALFDLSRDLAERDDLAARMPREAEELHRRLNDYLAAVGAALPTVNPQYDPERPPAARQRRRGGRRQQQGSRPRPDPILVGLDRDGDGELSIEEIEAAPGVLRRLDQNGDGTLTTGEIRARRRERNR